MSSMSNFSGVFAENSTTAWVFVLASFHVEEVVNKCINNCRLDRWESEQEEYSTSIKVLRHVKEMLKNSKHNEDKSTPTKKRKICEGIS